MNHAKLVREKDFKQGPRICGLPERTEKASERLAATIPSERSLAF